MIEAVSKRRQKNGVNIHTPHRIFVLNTKSKKFQEKWVDVLMDTLTVRLLACSSFSRGFISPYLPLLHSWDVASSN